jgi:hypothetical protein
MTEWHIALAEWLIKIYRENKMLPDCLIEIADKIISLEKEIDLIDKELLIIKRQIDKEISVWGLLVKFAAAIIYLALYILSGRRRIDHKIPPQVVYLMTEKKKIPISLELKNQKVILGKVFLKNIHKLDFKYRILQMEIFSMRDKFDSNNRSKLIINKDRHIKRMLLNNLGDFYELGCIFFSE